MNHPKRKSVKSPDQQKINTSEPVSADRDADCKHGVDVTDEKVLCAVDAICLSCGEQERGLLLSGHPFLTPKILTRIKNSTPERQTFEIDQIRQGIRPFSTKTKPNWPV